MAIAAGTSSSGTRRGASELIAGRPRLKTATATLCSPNSRQTCGGGVAPPAAEHQMPAQQADAGEAVPLQDPLRADMLRARARLDAVELQLAERDRKRFTDGPRGEAPAGMRLVDPVPEDGALQRR